MYIKFKAIHINTHITLLHTCAQGKDYLTLKHALGIATKFFAQNHTHLVCT